MGAVCLNRCLWATQLAPERMTVVELTLFLTYNVMEPLSIIYIVSSRTTAHDIHAVIAIVLNSYFSCDFCACRSDTVSSVACG